MATYYLNREDELAVQLEATYGTSPGALVAGDFFKHTSTRVAIAMSREELFRDNDASYGKASVTEMHTGRGKTTVSIEGHVVPSGNASTPTAPDMDLLYKAALGASNTRTAHTTTAAGSTGTTLQLVSGGGAASGIVAGDLIGVDVSSAAGIEVRRVVSITTLSATKAHAHIGSGVNGVVTAEVTAAGAAGNVYTITVALGVGNNQALAASLVGTDITVTLATDSDGFPKSTENTATLVAAAVGALTGIDATASGNGSGVLNDAEASQTFTGGSDAPAGDTVTVDAAFTTDPAAARAVYVGTTYRLSVAALNSLHLWEFNGDNLRRKTGGVVINEMEISCAFSEGVPSAKVSFKGEGAVKAVHSTSKPTATTAGQIATPDLGKVWIGGVKYPIVSCSLSVKNGLELRNNQSDALAPTGLKRTGNNARYQVESTVELYQTSDTETGTLFMSGDTRTVRALIVQLGETVGQIVAWACPAWRPRAEETEIDGESGLRLTGRALGTSGDDEVYLSFI